MLQPLSRRLLMAAVFLAVTAMATSADEPIRKNLLLVTHSGGFIHDSVGTAEDVLKAIGPKHGINVTCWRFTNDPDARITVKAKKGGQAKEMNALESYNNEFRPRTGKAVEKENCGRINAETLKHFDAVLFFTTGNPVNRAELQDLLAWVKAGGGFCGTHCATDTLYGDAEYGDLIGGYFGGHPPGLQKVKLRIDDPKHPAAKAFDAGMMYEDEIYVFRETGNFKQQPYSREKLNVILSCEPGSFDAKNLKRKDGDYAISWSKDYGKGKVFYTSFGHQKKVWNDPRFQDHLIAGIKWSMGQK